MKITAIRGWLAPPGLLLYGAIFFFINALFVVKYGTRFSVAPMASAGGYFVFLALQCTLAGLAAWWVARARRPLLWLALVLAAYLAVALTVYLRIDPQGLQTDRWSALDHFWRAFFAGGYPYAAETHLGSPISGFPGLMLLALPFYALGDVGYLQFAALIAWVVLAAARLRDGARPLYLLVALIAMPVFAYQIFCRSDLMGNMVAAAWLLHLSLKPGAARGGRLWLWAAAWGLMLSTRGIVFIPLILASGPLLNGRGFKAAALFYGIAAAVFFATFAPFYLWDPQLFADHNPFNVQADYVPRWLLAAVLSACAALAWRRRAAPNPFVHAGLMLFATILACWALRAAELGWQATLWNHEFDIAYYFLPVPFLLIGFGQSLPSRSMPETSDASRKAHS